MTIGALGFSLTFVLHLSFSGGVSYTHPLRVTSWVDDIKQWPEVSVTNVVCYLVRSKACDLKEAEAFKSLDSYNYLQSGWVGQVLSYKLCSDITCVKADVRPSQAVNKKSFTAWAVIQNSGPILTGGCSCMAGQARVCSHVGAVLWKVEMAVELGLTGHMCTDRAAVWNRGTTRNVEPGLVENMNFKLKRATVDPEPDQGQMRKRKVKHFGSRRELLGNAESSLFKDLLLAPGCYIHIYLEIKKFKSVPCMMKVHQAACTKVEGFDII